MNWNHPHFDEAKSKIKQKLEANPDQDVPALVRQELEPACRQLQEWINTWYTIFWEDYGNELGDDEDLDEYAYMPLSCLNDFIKEGKYKDYVRGLGLVPFDKLQILVYNKTRHRLNTIVITNKL